MGEISKNVNKVNNSQLIVPENLSMRKRNYEQAGYTFTFDETDKQYIEFNTLCEKRPEEVKTRVVKAYRLLDRETDQEYLVYFQERSVKDFNGKTRVCPCDEIIGVVPKPKTDFITNSQDEVEDISKKYTENEYYLEFTPEEAKAMFEKSIDHHKIVCYTGYTKRTQLKETNFVDEKKIIYNQEAFVNSDIHDILRKNDNWNEKIAFELPKKVREIKVNKKDDNDTEKEVDNLKNLMNKKNKNDNDDNDNDNDNITSTNKKGGGTVDVEKEFKQLKAGGK